MVDTVAQISIDIFHAVTGKVCVAELVYAVQMVFHTCRTVGLTGFTAAPFNNPGIQFVKRVRTVQRYGGVAGWVSDQLQTQI